MKTCTTCKESKELSMFNRKNKKDLKSHCKSCQSAYNKAYKVKNKDRITAYYKNYHEENKEYLNAASRKYYSENKEYFSDWSKEYRAEHGERLNAYDREWYKNNPENSNARSAKRRAAKLQRTPAYTETCPWQKFWLKEHYRTAKVLEEMTGVKYHVDHIIPLQGELVSGLHIAENLQVITAAENLSKHNSYNVG